MVLPGSALDYLGILPKCGALVWRKNLQRGFTCFRVHSHLAMPGGAVALRPMPCRRFLISAYPHATLLRMISFSERGGSLSIISSMNYLCPANGTFFLFDKETTKRGCTNQGLDDKREVVRIKRLDCANERFNFQSKFVNFIKRDTQVIDLFVLPVLHFSCIFVYFIY